jgi:glycosyltransferase involved in cell wall biosynthesis
MGNSIEDLHGLTAMKLAYLANLRVPTEKAHGLQIMQMCEAFANAGAEVTLLAARRRNTPEMEAFSDPWKYYGVDPCFMLRRLWSLDLFPFLKGSLEGLAFLVQALTYTCAAFTHSLFHHADMYYSRDALTLLALGLIKPRHRLVWEAHHFSVTRLGIFLQRRTVRRVGSTIAVTQGLKRKLESYGARDILVAHDGFRLERFQNSPRREEARRRFGLPKELFLVGYVGRLETMSMGKGVDHLIDAIGRIENTPMGLCILGGPEEAAETLRSRWASLGLPSERFLFTGHVEPDRVAHFIAALDVCTLPFPKIEHYAHYASPLKLFEYMACGKPILASDLPAIAEVVRDGESAVLVPPEDAPAIAGALKRLYEDPVLRRRIGSEAEALAARYTWSARAKAILETVQAGTRSASPEK